MNNVCIITASTGDECENDDRNCPRGHYCDSDSVCAKFKASGDVCSQMDE